MLSYDSHRRAFVYRFQHYWKQLLLSLLIIGILTAPAMLFAAPHTPLLINQFAVTPTTPMVLTPTHNSTTNNPQPIISGVADPGVTINIMIDNTLDGSTIVDLVGHWVYTPAQNLSDGSHSIVAQAVSGVIQSTVSNTVIVTVDTQPPAPPVIITPSDGALLNTATPVITGTTELQSTVSIYLNGNNIGTAISDNSGQWSFSVVNPLADGNYTINAIATDTAQNASNYSVIHGFSIDTTAPDAPIILSPTNGAILSQNTLIITGTAEPDNSIIIMLDGMSMASTQANGSGSWHFNVKNALSDGVHHIQAKATDPAGNSSASSADIQFTIDTQPPTTQITSKPYSQNNSPDGSFDFQGSDATSSITGFFCSIDAALPETCTSPFLFRGLADGKHLFAVYAVDAANNHDPTPATYLWEINTKPVTVTLNQASNQSDPTGFVPIHYTAIFNKPVTGFDDPATDLLINGSAPGQLNATITGGPTIYTIAVGGMTGSGSVSVAIPAGAATDFYGNQSQAATSNDASVTFSADQPIVTGIVRILPNPTNQITLTWRVTFSEPVQGVDPTDFQLVASVGSGAIVKSIAGSGTTYTIIVDRGQVPTGATIGLNLIDDDSIHSQALQVPLAGVGQGNGNTTGEAYTIQPIWRNYLPGITFGGPYLILPDLIVDQIKTERGQLTIIIKNIGRVPVKNTFWVDLYIAPDQPPVMVNQIWQQQGQRGAAWGINQDIPVGGSLTLTIGDSFYHADLSTIGGPIDQGTILYVQVDSANATTDYGAVLETHEWQGGPYNNIAKTIAVSTILPLK